MRKLLLSLSVLAALGATAADLPIVTKQYLSPVYTIDKKYRSMEGPGALDKVYLGDADSETPELLWIIGVKTEMVGEDGKTPQLPELMCHVNVDLDTQKHSAMLGVRRYTAPRLVTLSQGMLDAEVPEGFGFPIASNEPLILYTQVLNHNIEHPNNMKVRHRVTISYIRDKDLKTPLKPLFNVGASGTVILDNNPMALMSMPSAPTVDLTQSASASSSTATAGHEGHDGHGTSCLLLPRAPNANTGSDYTDPNTGKKVTGHWVVPPGHQVNKSDITWFMGLPYDTTLHYAAVHLHPFAKSLAIRDTTTGQLIFEAKAEGPKDSVGLSHVDTFASKEGVKLYRSHKYELVSEYDNPTDHNADSMASAFLGLADPEFVHPDAATLAKRAATLLDTSTTAIGVVRTSLGDFEVTFLRNEAPAAVRSFVRLARTGGYDHAKIGYLSKARAEVMMPPLNDVQRSVAAQYKPETSAPQHEAGMLSMCMGEPRFAIVLDKDPNHDGSCAPFARVGAGAEVIRAIAAAASETAGPPATPIEIRRVDIYDTASDPRIVLAAAAGK